MVAHDIVKMTNIEPDLKTSLRKKEIPKQAPSEETARKNIETEKAAKQAIENIIKQFGSSKDLKMYYDKDLGRMIVSVVDSETQQVVREIPPDELISFLKKFKQYIGTLIDRRI